ncbi:MarR family winged helix-turn-helix transcriptional regulator [Chungangia koreensis]|uniref:MarR family winged helix-turn-helix transcriptional regulator n=1 Tax=Chungangia koreensis TaxID=752657 RepID=A0ABV8X122_9LACT
MMSDLFHLDVIDLISERHLMLRGKIEEYWNDNSELRVSNSEWFILAKVYKKSPTIASISKSVDITRQATHKLVKGLESKGLVEVQQAEGNKKEKTLSLTELGIENYERYLSIKENLMNQIIATIGEEKFTILKDILASDWKIE